MSIQERNRGGEGERNTYQRKNISEREITGLLVSNFMSMLEDSLTTGVNLSFESSVVIQHLHDDRVQCAYLTNFYPLDVELEVEEQKEVIRTMSYGGYSGLPAVIKEMLREQVKNIVEEVERVKRFHPDTEVTVYFSPADTLDHCGTVAKPIYGWIIFGEKAYFQSECSFVVIPHDESSRAYMSKD